VVGGHTDFRPQFIDSPPPLHTRFSKQGRRLKNFFWGGRGGAQGLETVVAARVSAGRELVLAFAFGGVRRGWEGGLLYGNELVGGLGIGGGL
jgi:hypothetical protein